MRSWPIPLVLILCAASGSGCGTPPAVPRAEVRPPLSTKLVPRRGLYFPVAANPVTGGLVIIPGSREDVFGWAFTTEGKPPRLRRLLPATSSYWWGTESHSWSSGGLHEIFRWNSSDGPRHTSLVAARVVEGVIDGRPHAVSILRLSRYPSKRDQAILPATVRLAAPDDLTYLAAFSLDCCKVIIWKEHARGEYQEVYRASFPFVQAVGFPGAHPKYAVVLAWDGMAGVGHLDSMTLVSEQRPGACLNRWSFEPTAPRVAIHTHPIGGQVYEVDSNGLRPVFLLPERVAGVISVSLVGSVLAVLFADGAYHVEDLTRGKGKGGRIELPTGHGAILSQGSSQHVIAVVDELGRISAIELPEGKLLDRLPADRPCLTLGLSWSRLGKREFLIANGRAFAWALGSGKPAAWNFQQPPGWCVTSCGSSIVWRYKPAFREPGQSGAWTLGEYRIATGQVSHYDCKIDTVYHLLHLSSCEKMLALVEDEGRSGAGALGCSTKVVLLEKGPSGRWQHRVIGPNDVEYVFPLAKRRPVLDVDKRPRASGPARTGHAFCGPGASRGLEDIPRFSYFSGMRLSSS
jgi:hypothetical protein